MLWGLSFLVLFILVFNVLLVSMCAFPQFGQGHFYDFLETLDYVIDIGFYFVIYIFNSKVWCFPWSLTFEGFSWHFLFLMRSFVI